MTLPDDCLIEVPAAADWQIFQRLAAEEGWRVPAHEPAWYQQAGPGTAFVLRYENEAVGFVSVMPHAASGWIGNLIVAEKHRGHGFGRLLFLQALNALRWQGLPRAWLTASALGLPLYEPCGFTRVARIERWFGKSVGNESLSSCPQPDEKLWQELLVRDRQVWGEDRSRFLNRLRECSSLLRAGDGLLLLQQHAGFSQIGPWYADGSSEGELLELLEQALGQVPLGGEVVVDVSAASMLTAVLPKAGFVARSDAGLMVAGGAELLARERLLALASLGSAG